MGIFITEDWLRSHSTLSEGTEIRLPVEARLTPSAQSILSDRRISIKYVSEDGRLFVDRQASRPAPAEEMPGPRAGAVVAPVAGGVSGAGPVGAAGIVADEPQREQVHALTSSSSHEPAACQMCRQVVQGKPDTMTHLNAHTLVAKNNPCLLFRGQLDSAIALAVWLQVELGSVTHGWLDDIRSVLGNIMRAEVTGNELISFAVGGLDAVTLHSLSHNPLRTLGHDHLVPEAAHGRTVVMLNMLRTKVREAELSAAQIFINPDFTVSRPDIMQGLNRLSSAVYVLMLLCLLADGGKPWPSADQLLQAATREAQ